MIIFAVNKNFYVQISHDTSEFLSVDRIDDSSSQCLVAKRALLIILKKRERKLAGGVCLKYAFFVH